MKINLKDEDLKKLNSILTIRDNNINASELYNIILNDYYDNISANDFTTSTYEKEFFTILMNNANLSIEEDVISDLIKYNQIDKIKLLDKKDYINNDYYKKIINTKKITSGDFKIDINYFMPYELFLYDQIKDNDYHEINNLGFFIEKFLYITLLEKNKIWMSITPYEINSMKNNVSLATKDVLTFGLGLGYFQYMISTKIDVKSITIIEKNKEIINLFNNYLLPLFKYKNKINIINDDMYNFLNKNNKTYDYVFFDTYHDEEEGLYCLLKLINNKYKIKNVDFWIKDSILILARRYLLSIIEEYYQGYTFKDYKLEENNSDYIINSLYKIYENINIDSIKELEEMLKLVNIEKKLFSMFN